MIGFGTIITVCITFFICMILPIIIYIVYGVKNKGKGVWTAWLLGAAGFFVMQIILRTPILNLLSLTPGFMDFVTNNYIWYCILAAATAALFELVGRVVVAKILAKKMTSTVALAAGLGHGSIEAMTIVGMTYVNNLIYIALINLGQFDTIVAQTADLGVDTSSLVQIKESLIGTHPGIFLLAGYERILTVLLHIALSMLVCYFVMKKKTFKGIIIVFICHFAVDFIAAILNGMATPYVGSVLTQSRAYVYIYIFLTLVGIASIGVIYKLVHRKEWLPCKN